MDNKLKIATKILAGLCSNENIIKAGTFDFDRLNTYRYLSQISLSMAEELIKKCNHE